METIKVKSVKVKKQTDTYTIREIETEDGKKYDTFEDLKEGTQVSGTITPNKNPKYNANFKSDAPKKAFSKDWNFEKRKVALECAVNFGRNKDVKTPDILKVAGEFLKFLNLK